MTSRLEFALDAVHRAGKSTLAHFQAGVRVELKEDSTPVTVADKNAEQIIRDMVAKAFPEDAVLGEEQGETGAGPHRWVVDPIDGTKSFICGVPLYATLLSYEEYGVPILGACYLPALDQLVYAELGAGAFSNGRRISVSQRPTLTGSVVACGGHNGMVEAGRMAPFLEHIAPKTLATRTWGDAYGYVLLAEGQIDAMVDPSVNRWDISPMSVIITEAGGEFTNFKGERGLYNEALASNGLVHEELVAAFRS